MAMRMGAWLVVDLDSTPGGQPVAGAGVEALARGVHPYVPPVVVERQEFTRALTAACHRGVIDAELIAAAPSIRLITIGAVEYGAEVATGVHEVESQNVLTVRGPDGGSYCVLWTTLGACLEYMPDAPRHTILPFASLAHIAQSAGRGLVVDPYGATVSLTAQQLATLWPRSPGDAGAR